MYIEHTITFPDTLWNLLRFDHGDGEFVGIDVVFSVDVELDQFGMAIRINREYGMLSKGIR